ncbi:MFS transporter [Pullulanibacillus sp. KACC 23026]|uniref:MFS transporter n=1 Tax=Pullulanibacillus sp. KACC 23026 TaxID=3028315 RepID=UPI0023AFF8C0|nr:MFS transporter [Pullulanibacillus sp. KACC 23026]WEG12453.1 MFS transporter [Pullulanibacillus sp. KACC 23026]
MNKAIPKGRWLHIIPPAILVYIVAFMDRSNISFALAGGMDKELHMTATFGGLAAGIFFVGYLFLQVPGGLIASKGNAKLFIACTIIVWGVLAIISGFVQNPTQLLVVRFLLGVAEGGVWPAVLVILANWFPREELGRANAFFLMNLAIASIITGPLSGWILSFSSWRDVFIIEGIISLALILVWLPLISNRPEDAKWISKEERDYLVNKLREEQEELSASGGAKASFKDIFANVNMWKLILIYFFYQTGIYGFSLWLPTIIKGLTNSGMTGVGLLSALPYIGAIFGLYFFAKFSDKTGNRKLYTALPMAGFAICLILAVVFHHQVWVAFAFLVGCGVFVQSASSIFWTMPPLLFKNEVAGGARGAINGIGNLGGFLGPYLVGWLTTVVNQNAGIYSLVISLAIGFILTMTLPKVTSGKAESKKAA